jgi:hypothetical protein
VPLLFKDTRKQSRNLHLSLPITHILRGNERPKKNLLGKMRGNLIFLLVIVTWKKKEKKKRKSHEKKE